MFYVRWDIYERYVVQEAIDPDVMESIGLVGENVSVASLFAEIPRYSSKSGQLQGLDVHRSKPKLLVSHRIAFPYYI